MTSQIVASVIVMFLVVHILPELGNNHKSGSEAKRFGKFSHNPCDGKGTSSRVLTNKFWNAADTSEVFDFITSLYSTQ